MHPLYDDAREARATRRLADLYGADPVLAVVGDVPAETTSLSVGGWRVAGRLVGDAAAQPAGVPAYRSITEVLADGGLDAVCLDPAVPGSGRLLSACLDAALHVLLPQPGSVDPEELRDAVGAAEDAGLEIAVAFASRWLSGYATAARMVHQRLLPLPVQVSVRGWPRGAVALAELVDVIGCVAGDVVAVAAAGSPLPAETLPDGLPVRLALLTEVGTTVLVADGGEPGLRLSTAEGRLLLTAGQLSWEDGRSRLPLDHVAVHPFAGPALGPASEQLPGPRPPASGQEGLVATAARLARTARTGDGHSLEPDADGTPRVGTGRDLLVAMRVQAAVTESLAKGAWIEI